MNLEIIMLSEKSQRREFMPGVCSHETLQKAERSVAKSAGREKREGGARKSGVMPMVFTFAAMATLTSLNSPGLLGGWVGEASDSGHDLTTCGFEPHVGLCADSLKPGARFRIYVFLSLSASPTLTLSQK